MSELCLGVFLALAQDLLSAPEIRRRTDKKKIFIFKRDILRLESEVTNLYLITKRLGVPVSVGSLVGCGIPLALGGQMGLGSKIICMEHLKAKFFLIVGLAACGIALGCSTNAAQSAKGGGMPAMPVKVLDAKAMPVSDATDYVATLKSRESAVIMPQVEGQVTAILVHSGNHVAAGTPLMEIDPLRQQASVKSQESARAALQANVIWTKQQYDRYKELFAAGVVSRQDLDQVKAAMDQAQSQMDAASAQVSEQQVQLHYYRVLAPLGGIVGDVPVRVGDRVTTSTQLTTVDQPGSLEVYVYVPIEHSSELKMNLPVQVLDGEGKVVADTRISFISPQVDNATQTVLVKGRVGNGHDALRQLQFVRARVIYGTHQSPEVPILAVSRLAGQYFAFVAEPQPGGSFVARQKPLKIGQTVGNDYEVQEGIKPGDKVIISGTQFLLDGVPVIPQS
jgi:RND family efflux transporter MFP subunit